MKMQNTMARKSMMVDTEPVVLRNGDCNVTMSHVKNKQRSRYMMDLYTTIVDAQWRYTLFIFISGFTLSWLFFGFIWYVIIRVHGDDISVTTTNSSDHRQPCVQNVKTFAAAFLFSLESQHTIGYGVRVITEECPTAICVLCIQSITGVILQAFMAGVVFAKLTRSKARANTLLFSRKAVVCLRDQKMVLMFRVADLRKSLIVGANVRAQLIRPRKTVEGEELPFHMTKVKVGGDDYTDDLLFIWPITIVHVIDSDSPFYGMNASNMLNEKFEMIVYLEGTSESTGTTMQARYSYRNVDILWGNRFQLAISYDMMSMNYVIDFDKFEKTISVPTPLVSAHDWDLLTKNNNAPPQTYNGMQLVVFDPHLFDQSQLVPANHENNRACQQRNSSPSYPVGGGTSHGHATDHFNQNVLYRGSCPFSSDYQSLQLPRRSEDDGEQETQELNITMTSEHADL